MAKFEYTRGPWVSHKCPITGGKSGFVIQNQRHRGITIATLFPGISSDRIEEVCEANARLIAEAPAMLEALRFYAGWGVNYPDQDDTIREDSGDKARAILARIEGGAK